MAGERMRTIEGRFVLARCDVCGVLVTIGEKEIPERDMDLDDELHDNRPAVARCGITYELDSGPAPCDGEVYFVGFLPILAPA